MTSGQPQGGSAGILGTVLAGLALVALASASSAQITGLPFDLVEVSEDQNAPDHCGIFFAYFDFDPGENSDVGGVSLADFDNDGLVDAFFPNSKTRASRLYRNLGDGTFVDVATQLGVADPASASANGLFVDYDHDGDLDLVVVSHLGKPAVPLGPPVRFFRNGGAANGWAFSNVTTGAGFVFGPTAKATLWGYASGIAAGDYDKDGWVDLFLSWHGGGQSQDQWRLFRNAPNPTPGDPQNPAYSPRVFLDVTPGSGLEQEWGGDPWQAMFWDVNLDGYFDIHIAQDKTLDIMFVNNQDGTFTNVATAVGLNGDPPEFRNEMGTDLGDPDLDLDLDMHTTNVGAKDRYYRNDCIQDALLFTDIAPQTGLHDSVFGWGTVFADLDNDADEDHVAVTGFEHDETLVYSNPVHLNLYPQLLPDGNVKWATVTYLLPAFSKIDTPDGDSARGLVDADYDNDGDLDLFVTRSAGGRAGVFVNTLPATNGWLQVDLVETGGHLDTTGTRLYLHADGRTQFRELFTGSSFLCQEPARQHFGLGALDLPTTARPKLSGDGGATMGSGGPLAGVGPVPGGKPGVAAEVDPKWLVVRWRDGSYQIVTSPKRNTRVTVEHAAQDDAGDMDGDGHLTSVDETMILLAAQDLTAFKATYPDSPGTIVGDLDGDRVIDADDVTAWYALPPH